jgi:hypothetical protein
MTPDMWANAAHRWKAEDAARQITPGLVEFVLAGLWEAVILFRFRVLSRYTAANVEHPSTVQRSLFCHFYLIATSSAPY